MLVDKTERPRCDPRVQRRRYGRAPYLVLHHRWVELDDVADTVWLGCHKRQTVEEIVLSVSESIPCPLHEALAATVAILEFLRENGFVTYMVTESSILSQ